MLLLPQIENKKASDFEINQERFDVDAKIFVRTIDFEYSADRNYIEIMKDRILESVQNVFDIIGENPPQTKD